MQISNGYISRRDIVERGGKLVSKISWGHPMFEPSFWPNNIAPWSKVTNIAHPQKEKFCMTMSEILKEAIKKRLEMKGLDYNEHVTENVNKITERNKERYRKGCRTFQHGMFFSSRVCNRIL